MTPCIPTWEAAMLRLQCKALPGEAMHSRATHPACTQLLLLGAQSSSPFHSLQEKKKGENNNNNDDDDENQSFCATPSGPGNVRAGRTQTAGCAQSCCSHAFRSVSTSGMSTRNKCSYYAFDDSSARSCQPSTAPVFSTGRADPPGWRAKVTRQRGRP